MRKIDYKHIAFHTLSAIYYIWIAVFCVLIAMALGNVYGGGSASLSRALLMWILLNIVTGSALFLVLRQFHPRAVVRRFILHTYLFMAVTAIVSVIVIVFNLKE